MKRIIALLLTICLILGTTGCKKPAVEQPAEETPTGPILGNPDDTEGNGYLDSPSVKAPDLGSEGVGTGISYEARYYLTPEDIPEKSYCIEHTEMDGSTKYYVPYKASSGWRQYDKNNRGQEINYWDAFTNYTIGARAADPGRFAWVKDDLDENVIPTMYAGDKFIYRSKDIVMETFSLERFSDEGYTIGVAGLVASISGNYMFTTEKGYAEPDSDTVNLDQLGASEIYIVSVGSERVSDANVSETGFITGLEKDKNYQCDVRTGTESILAAFRANIHIFVSMEQYMIAKFYFSHPLYIEIAFEENMPSGYYSINGSGLFRYISESDLPREEKMRAQDYNIPFFISDSNGEIISTKDGFAVDENGYITRQERKQQEIDRTNPETNDNDSDSDSTFPSL